MEMCAQQNECLLCEVDDKHMSTYLKTENHKDIASTVCGRRRRVANKENVANTLNNVVIRNTFCDTVTFCYHKLY